MTDETTSRELAEGFRPQESDWLRGQRALTRSFEGLLTDMAIDKALDGSSCPRMVTTPTSPRRHGR